MLSKKEHWEELTAKLIKCHALKIAARLEEEWGCGFKQLASNFQIRSNVPSMRSVLRNRGFTLSSVVFMSLISNHSSGLNLVF